MVLEIAPICQLDKPTVLKGGFQYIAVFFLFFIFISNVHFNPADFNQFVRIYKTKRKRTIKKRSLHFYCKKCDLIKDVGMTYPPQNRDATNMVSIIDLYLTTENVQLKHLSNG